MSSNGPVPTSQSLPVDHTVAPQTPPDAHFNLKRWMMTSPPPAVGVDGETWKLTSLKGISSDTHKLDTIVVKGESYGVDYTTSACVVLHPKDRLSPFEDITIGNAPVNSPPDATDGDAPSKRDQMLIKELILPFVLTGSVLILYLISKKMIPSTGTLGKKLGRMSETNGIHVVGDLGMKSSRPPFGPSSGEVSTMGQIARMSSEVVNAENRISALLAKLPQKSALIDMESRLLKSIEAQNREIQAIAHVIKTASLKRVDNVQSRKTAPMIHEMTDSAPIAQGINEARLTQVVRFAVEDVFSSFESAARDHGDRTLNEIIKIVRQEVKAKSNSAQALHSELAKDFEAALNELKGLVADVKTRAGSAADYEFAEAVDSAPIPIKSDQAAPMSIGDIQKNIKAYKEMREAEQKSEVSNEAVDRADVASDKVSDVGEKCTSPRTESRETTETSSPVDQVRSGSKPHPPGKRSLRLRATYNFLTDLEVDDSGEYTLTLRRPMGGDKEGFRHYRAVLVREKVSDPNQGFAAEWPFSTTWVTDAFEEQSIIIPTKVFDIGSEDLVVAEINGKFWKCRRKAEDGQDLVFVVCGSMDGSR